MDQGGSVFVQEVNSNPAEFDVVVGLVLGSRCQVPLVREGHHDPARAGLGFQGDGVGVFSGRDLGFEAAFAVGGKTQHLGGFGFASFGETMPAVERFALHLEAARDAAGQVLLGIDVDTLLGIHDQLDILDRDFDVAFGHGTRAHPVVQGDLVLSRLQAAYGEASVRLNRRRGRRPFAVAAELHLDRVLAAGG